MTACSTLQGSNITECAFKHNVYDVTKWPEGNAYDDIGAVINSMIAQIKAKQNETEHGPGKSEGKPGAVIAIPPGDYHLKTPVVIDISYLRIEGSGHGFISSSIRFNTEESALKQYRDIWPGGSRILVDLEVTPKEAKSNPEKGAAFIVKRDGLPRISSVEFSGFCIDGLHFTKEDGVIDENSYLNGKTGILVESANDSFCLRDMGFIYLEHGVVLHESDALTIDNNFIAECGNCVELLDCGQASKISNNLMGAGFCGHTIYAENFGGLLISANNIFPRGRSSIHLKNVARSNVSSNRLHTFYSGAIILEGQCCENLISSNHILRDHEPWAPMQGYDNGIFDDYGVIHIEGNANSVMSNHISNSIEKQYLRFAAGTETKPVIMRIAAGHGNYLAHNHIVATDPAVESSDSSKEVADASACFNTQVEAILSINRLKPFDAIIELQVDKDSKANTCLYTAHANKVKLNADENAFVALPTL